MLRMNVLLCIFLFFLGLLYNLTESYDCAFYFAASLFLMGGAVMALPVLKFHKAPGPPIHATRSTSTIETQTFSDEDKFLTDWFTVIPSVPYIFAFVFVLEYVKYRFLFSWWKNGVFYDAYKATCFLHLVDMLCACHIWILRECLKIQGKGLTLLIMPWEFRYRNTGCVVHNLYARRTLSWSRKATD